MVANSDGLWNSNPLEMKISVATPWWKTAWFKLLLTFVIGGIVYALYAFRLRQVRKEERLKTSFDNQLANVEMSALRSQMNPHFIFNCLNSIDHYIIKNESKKASEYLNSFSRLIRLILQNSRNNYVNLQDEIEALKLYIEMESLRFNHKFDYHINVEEGLETDSIEIPPMLLQPYVENAIWHGLMHKQGKGVVQLDISYDNNILYCIIKDDGIGREKAMSLKSRNRTRKKSMGMRITEDRINMINKLYNSNTSVKIIDMKNQAGEATGTKVELAIPV